MRPERNRYDEPIVVGRLEPDDDRGLYNTLTVAVTPPDPGFDDDAAEPSPAAVHVFVTSFIDERELGVTREGADIEHLIGLLGRAKAIAAALNAGVPPAQALKADVDVASTSTSTSTSVEDRAVDAVIEAVRGEQDFGGWVARVLATAAAELGSSRALIAGRPGSWEADLVHQLVCGTVGWEDELLGEYKRGRGR